MSLTFISFPRNCSKTLTKKVLEMRETGMSMQEISDRLGIRMSLVSDIFRRMRISDEQTAARGRGVTHNHKAA